MNRENSGADKGLAATIVAGLRRALTGTARMLVGPPSDERRDSLLLDAAVLVRLGQPDKALSLLRPWLRVLTRDPAYLNLLGVIHECRGRPGVAIELYRVAADPDYGPARVNLYRLESAASATGSARLNMTLGDVELRASRAVESTRE